MELLHDLPPSDRIVSRERDFAFLTGDRGHARLSRRQILDNQILEPLTVDDGYRPFAGSSLISLPVWACDPCPGRALPEQVDKIHHRKPGWRQMRPVVPEYRHGESRIG